MGLPVVSTRHFQLNIRSQETPLLSDIEYFIYLSATTAALAVYHFFNISVTIGHSKTHDLLAYCGLFSIVPVLLSSWYCYLKKQDLVVREFVLLIQFILLGIAAAILLEPHARSAASVRFIVTVLHVAAHSVPFVVDGATMEQKMGALLYCSNQSSIGDTVSSLLFGRDVMH
ncbi:MAG: hypothetical protein KatS3mg105_4093 [Gemmatales bacterium]|nr:MAG: hypothetical protein KatS3mg105_4093 [Gemmatales bacterium]